MTAPPSCRTCCRTARTATCSWGRTPTPSTSRTPLCRWSCPVSACPPWPGRCPPPSWLWRSPHCGGACASTVHSCGCGTRCWRSCRGRVCPPQVVQTPAGGLTSSLCYRTRCTPLCSRCAARRPPTPPRPPSHLTRGQAPSSTAGTTSRRALRPCLWSGVTARWSSGPCAAWAATSVSGTACPNVPTEVCRLRARTPPAASRVTAYASTGHRAGCWAGRGWGCRRSCGPMTTRRWCGSPGATRWPHMTRAARTH